MVGLLTRSDYAGAKMEVEDEEGEGNDARHFIIDLAQFLSTF